MTTLHSTPISPAIGSEIHGLDLAKPLPEETLVNLRQTLADRGVIFFRDQELTPDQHLAFARSFGGIEINRFFTPVPGQPEIAEVRKEPDQKKAIGEAWHTDCSYDTEPALGSILYAREVPPNGGDTLFASMYAAYEALSPGLQKMLCTLKAVHSSVHIFGATGALANKDMANRIGNPDAAKQYSVHPVIITHPVSGRKAMYVNRAFTTHFEGWTPEESAPLLQFLYKHAEKPEFQCRFNWKVGSMAFWDNRCTWHYAANDYHGHRRLMHRITLAGTTLG